MKTKILTILIIAVLIVAGGAGYYFYLSRDEVLRDKTSQEQIDETANWKIYRNEKYGFELKYPDRVHVVEFGPEYYAKAEKEYWEKYQKKIGKKLVN